MRFTGRRKWQRAPKGKGCKTKPAPIFPSWFNTSCWSMTNTSCITDDTVLSDVRIRPAPTFFLFPSRSHFLSYTRKLQACGFAGVRIRMDEHAFPVYHVHLTVWGGIFRQNAKG